MKKLLVLALIINLISCEKNDPSNDNFLIEPLKTEAFDYGDSGTSRDILIRISFATTPPSAYSFKVVIAKADIELTAANAISLSEDKTESIVISDKTYQSNLLTEIKDSDDDLLRQGREYHIYLLTIDSHIESGVQLSMPSSPFRLIDEKAEDLYILSNSISGRNPYFLDPVNVVLAEVPNSVDMIFDEFGNLLLLTQDDGVMEYNADGQFVDTLISNEFVTDPKVIRIGPDSDLYIIDGSSILRFNKDSGQFIDTYMEGLTAPSSIAWDQFEQMYVTEKVEVGRVLTFNKSKTLVNAFSFKNPSIVPKSVTYNKTVQKIYINRTSINGTGIVEMDPATLEWVLLGSLQTLGTFSDYFVTNAEANFILVREDHRDGPQMVVVEHKADVDLEIIAMSPPLSEIPKNIALGPKRPL